MISIQLLFLVLVLVACMLAVHGMNLAENEQEGAGGQAHIMSYHGSTNNGPHGK